MMEQDIKLHDITMIELMSSTITRKERISIMVILKNIIKTKNSVSANYYPEGNMNEDGFMEMSIPDKKIIAHKKAVEYSTAPAHVMYALRDIVDVDKDDFPEEIAVLWY